MTAWLEEIRPLYCRMCGQCDGKCPQGLPVADVLRYLMYAEGYGQFPLGREQFLALPAGPDSGALPISARPVPSNAPTASA